MASDGRCYHPQEAGAARYDRAFGIYKDIYPSLRDSFAKLKDAIDDDQ